MRRNTSRIDNGLIADVGSESSGARYHFLDEHGTVECHYQVEVVHLDGWRETTLPIAVSHATHIDRDTMPHHFARHQNHPNPFNPETVIQYDLSRFSTVQLSIYNAHGHLVRTLVQNVQAPGHHTLFWDRKEKQGQNVGSGLYFYELKTDTFCQTRKMTILR